MRVQGNAIPEAIHIEQYPPMEGYVEVRLRENITAISYTDTETGATISMYEYDEYVFHLPARAGLEADIEANLSDWLITGRTLEYNDQASIAADMAAALEVLGVSE